MRAAGYSLNAHMGHAESTAAARRTGRKWLPEAARISAK
jgi:hypothetical protein